jgi:hypothetical protein
VDGTGYRIAAAHLTHALEASRSLHSLLMRCIHVRTIQTATTEMSNSESVLSERLARWLLMCHHRVDCGELVLTHEFLSLGVSRQNTPEERECCSNWACRR